MIAALLAAVALSQVPLPSQPSALPPASPAPLPRSGALGAGIVLEPFALGAVQGIARGGVYPGLEVLGALLVDAGPRWAVRVQLDLVGGTGTDGFAMVGLTPGLVYRFRSAADQRWVPYLGAGVRLGAAGADRPVLGYATAATTAAPLSTAPLPSTRDWDHHSSSGSDPDFDSRAGAFPEAWAGASWHPRRWLAFDLGAAYTWVRLIGRDLHLLHERVGIRLEL